MACSSISLSGISLDCGNAGGISKVYLIPKDKVTAVSLNGTNVITGVTVTAPTKLSEYSFRKGNADYSFKTTKDPKSGTVSVDATINVTFNKMETAKRNEFAQMLADVTYGIVKDNNGIYWMVGYDSISDSYLDVTSLDGSTGAEMKDSNNYKLVLTSNQTVQPQEVLESVVLGLL